MGRPNPINRKSRRSSVPTPKGLDITSASIKTLGLFLYNDLPINVRMDSAEVLKSTCLTEGGLEGSPLLHEA